MTYKYLIIVLQIIFSVFILWLGGYDFSSRGPNTVLVLFVGIFVNFVIYVFISCLIFDDDPEKLNTKILKRSEQNDM
jgi:hypothetical protein